MTLAEAMEAVAEGHAKRICKPGCWVVFLRGDEVIVERST